MFGLDGLLHTHDGAKASRALYRGSIRGRSRILTIAVTASVLAWALLILTPMLAHAAELRQGESVVVAAGETVDDDLYVIGQSIAIQGTVTGDVIAAGQAISIDGSVLGDVMAAGQSVTLGGPISGAVRVAGQDVTISAPIERDLLVGAGVAAINPQASIGRDLLIGAGTATVDAPVGRSIRAGAERLTLGGPVGGDVLAQAGALRLTRDASIQGSLTYTSAQAATLEPGAAVQGMTTRIEPPAAAQPTPAAEAGEAVLGWMQTLVGISAFGLLLVLLFPSYSAHTTTTLMRQPWPSLGLGFAVLVGTPFAALLLFGVGLMIGGWWLGLLLLALLLALVPVGFTVAGLFVGQTVMHRLGRPYLAAGWNLLAGLILLGLVSVVPILGGLILFVGLLFGLGAAILTLALLYRGQSPASSTPAQHLHDLGEPIPAH